MASFGDTVASVSIFDGLTKGVWTVEEIGVLKKYGVVGTTGVWNTCQNNGIANFQASVLGQQGRPKFVWHQIVPTDTITKIRCDVTTYAFIAGGKIFTWANGTNGIGRTGTANVIGQVGTDSDWVDIATGNDFMLALKSDGTLWSWGRNDNGKTGRGVAASTVSAVGQIGTDTDWVEVAAGSENGYALKSNGDLYAWGSSANTGLNLSSGSTTSPTLVTSAQGLGTITCLSATNAAVGIVAGGKLYTAGSNANYATGFGVNTGVTLTFTQVGSDTDWVEIVYDAPYVTVARKSNGHVWGWNNSGATPFGASYQTPTRVAATLGPAGSQGVFSEVHCIGTNNSFVGVGYRSAADGKLYYTGQSGAIQGLTFPLQLTDQTVWGAGQHGFMFGVNSQ